MRYVSQAYDLSITPFVKALIVINISVWFTLVVILQGLFFESHPVFYFLGLIPEKVLSEFWIWQIFTYSFIHAPGVFHILFNMFALWMFGSELERLWGSRFFLIYYLFCGLGAGLFYLFSVFIGLSFFDSDTSSFFTPMIGASGAIFGILFAYGLIFGERIIYFMMIFPMKARHFTLLIGLVEFVSLIGSGMGSSISHLAHLCGFVSGFLFLQAWKVFQNFNLRRLRKRPGHLKIMENDDKEDKTLH